MQERSDLSMSYKGKDTEEIHASSQDGKKPGDSGDLKEKTALILPAIKKHPAALPRLPKLRVKARKGIDAIREGEGLPSAREKEDSRANLKNHHHKRPQTLALSFLTGEKNIAFPPEKRLEILSEEKKEKKKRPKQRNA